MTRAIQFRCNMSLILCCSYLSLWIYLGWCALHHGLWLVDQIWYGLIGVLLHLLRGIFLIWLLLGSEGHVFMGTIELVTAVKAVVHCTRARQGLKWAYIYSCAQRLEGATERVVVHPLLCVKVQFILCIVNSAACALAAMRLYHFVCHPFLSIFHKIDTSYCIVWVSKRPLEALVSQFYMSWPIRLLLLFLLLFHFSGSIHNMLNLFFVWEKAEKTGIHYLF